MRTRPVQSTMSPRGFRALSAGIAAINEKSAQLRAAMGPPPRGDATRRPAVRRIRDGGDDPVRPHSESHRILAGPDAGASDMTLMVLHIHHHVFPYLIF